MRCLTLILGSAAFLLSIWLTSGLLGNALLEPSEQDCSTAAVTREGASAGRLSPRDIALAVCMVHRDLPPRPPAVIAQAG
ncbi:hypothetical protein ACFOD4_15260 [Pseudoroseomonas globiformis]|uniref:Uncharacterized protein n=1 Tax=Teichococcus globiformis TaxID=2307229 RepID=A0ABV7G160_9PROT